MCAFVAQITCFLATYPMSEILSKPLRSSSFTEHQRRVFFDRVEKLATECGCWIWIGVSDSRNYGHIDFGYGTLSAHRVSYALQVGDIPENLYVCHRCDTPECVNPSHLFLGDAKANAEDCKQKGRNARGASHFSQRSPEKRVKGEKNGMAKLTEEKVKRIRFLAAKDFTYKEIARMEGIVKSNVHFIVSRQTWKHVK